MRESERPERSRRQSVTFSGEAAKLLEELSAERGVSVSEVLRTALTREAWFDKAEKEGKIYYKDANSADPPHEVKFILP